MSVSTVQPIRGYVLHERLGEGGFGVVYRAEQPSVNREVAIKVILPQLANQPDFIRRFEVEAQLVANLEHPYIVPLYDYWREPDGAYLVMRFLRGGNLSASLQKGPWSPENTARLLDQIASALDAAHRQGVVHRDVKPANILLDEERNAFLSDFGIAKDVSHTSSQTEPGAITGSLAYISPEQAQSLPVSAASDQYSLGVVMYEVLVGEHPFPGQAPTTQLLKHLTEPLPSLLERRPELPRALDHVIQRATAKDPAKRYPSTVDFAREFRAAITGATAITTAPAVDLSAPLKVSNPYKGLRAFQEADASDFFGRQTLVAQLLSRLSSTPAAVLPAHEPSEARFLAIVGPSGSGKSSVVKAGLIPALRSGALPGSEKWFILGITPGAHPLEELEIGLLRLAASPVPGLMEQLQRDERGLLRAARLVLPDEESEFLLVVDQFEEVFTLVEDKAEASHFLKILNAAVNDPRSRIRVIITLRADFYDRPLMHPDFSTLMQKRTEVVVPLTADELAQAIQKPSEQVGAVFEDGLVAAIVADTKDQPGALPLLQYALTELFERRAGHLLTREAYRSLGGVLGVLGRRAEEVFTCLDPAGQAVARQVFLRLVTLGEGTEDTRRRVLRAELLSLGQGQPNHPIEEVIEIFGRARLLSFDRDLATRSPTVEVAHEALLREWARLREWLDTSRADVRQQRLLGSAAVEWLNAQRDPSFLLRGARLSQFEGWAAGSGIALTPDEQVFLTASLAERQAEQDAEAVRKQSELEAAQKLAASERQRAEDQTRSARRLRYGAVFLALLAVAAVILAVVAFQARRTAQDERDKAQNQAAVNQSLLLAARASEANDAGDTDLALALALEAVNLQQPPAESVRSLSNIALGPGTRRILVGHSHEVTSVAFSPDGRSALSGSCKRLDAENQCMEGELFLWDLDTGSVTASLSGQAGWVNSVAFSPDGATAISASSDGLVLMWNVATGEILQRFNGHTAGVNNVAFAPDGLHFISASDDQTLILWDAVTGEVIRRFEGHNGAVYQASFSPSGSMIVSASQDTTLILWDVETGEIIRRLEGHTNAVTDAAFLPDGLSLVSCSWDMSLRLWDVQTGQQLRYQYFPVSLGSLALTSSGHTLLYNQIHELHFWNVDDWASTQPRLLGHTSVGIRDIAISPDGQQALTASNDGTLRLWNIEGQAGARRFENEAENVFSVAIRSDGQRLFTGSSVGTLWNIPSAQVERRFSGVEGVVSPGAAAFSPNGLLIVAATADFLGTSGATAAILWDAETGQEICRWEGREHAPRSAVFSPDGRSVLIGYQDIVTIYGELILWDAQTCQMVRRFSTNEDITGASFNAAGDLVLATSAFFSNVILWDVASGQEIRRYQLEAVPLFDVAFGPGEATVLAAVADGTLTEWDLETGALIRRFRGHESSVWSLDISRDGRYVISSSEGGEVILWNYETGQEVRRFRGHLSFVGSVVFSPDGRFAYSAAADGSIFEWPVGDLPLEDLVAWVADNRYVRELTCEERTLYQIEPLCPEDSAP